ncbi:MAG: bifunctional phosphopantothenoylcysteine decarboxylase/phosphopantothenate--cysteine ligase CoaBC [Bacteroidetes bacterium]|nr:MAG: bifunctional phosphopantothenoylcysteine decarboxylase/phosphopantothenate--cysteine ligase CoaBC [Bacteroidota bacterium]
MLQDRKIILAVSGSIAAYKAVYLLRGLKKAGATVRVVCTPDTARFVGPLTFSSLADGGVFDDLWGANWSEHVALGTWADLMLVAPATANTLAKMAHGQCDNALLAVFLAARCPVMIAPAMDADMYLHPRTQANLQALAADGHRVLPVSQGFLASGLEGPGRLLEPEVILAEVVAHFASPALAGKRVLITAGPTREAIDPVRYLSNHSTGKMGYALAAEAARRGAAVTLVSGPTSLPDPAGVETLRVQSTQDMYEAVMARAAGQDIVIMSAAVADYTPVTVAEQKLKKQGDNLTIVLRRTPDILHTLGQHKPPGQILVGFALETDQEEAHAREKLRKKNLDLIVLNSLRDPGAGFAHDTNKITLIDRTGDLQAFPLKSKKQVAGDILDRIVSLLNV